MFDQLYPILFLLVVAAVLAVVMAGASIYLGKRTRLGRKAQAYECGIEPVGTTKDPIPVKFFLVAISFILFDLEIIFLLPYAMVARDLGVYGLLAISFFVLIILIGYIYELGRGALKWG
ncbi:MAG: NADH-quinone oxidoreductase subunit A [candidate division Zixibacteria bacterium]|jgi:NADH-quinone oxidoreductase subunit A|nr:NADH-quinone oxidoreductase subunit A [candidate division Zixibacteria bacterium]